MDDPAIQSMIGRRIGHYRILDEIGRGGMGVVYRARDENLRCDVAIKAVPPSTFVDLVSRQRTRREALALSRLNHPAVVVVHDLISLPDCDCIVMELVAGESLDKILDRAPLPELDAVRLGIELARGLAAAHEAGVIHRDLKPGNLRVTRDGRLKILDFGLAKRTQPSTDTHTSDDLDSHKVVGTAHYVAPEVWDGEPAGEASDLYAAGIVLYEMATGQHPFHELPAGRIAHAALSVPPRSARQRNPAISAEFDALIMRCMEKSPPRRLSSARELADSLEALLSRLKHSAGTPPGPLRWVRVPRRAIWVAGALLLAVGVFVAGHLLGWWPGGGRAPTIRSLAVLPLVNLSGDAGQEYFADGMTDALITSLGEQLSIRVISRTSAMHYKATTKTLLEIARELAVDGVVQGSVRTSGERVRLSIQLIDGRADRQLWSKQYEDDRRDVLDIYHRVAKAVAREIGVQLSEGDRATRTGERRVDPAAYQLYLHGRYHWNRRSEDGIRRALVYFGSAIQKDSLFALAHSGLADAWATAGGMIPPLEAYPRAKQAALRALALDPGLSEGYVSLGNIQQNFEWDWDAAGNAYRRAIELNDNNAHAHHWYANHLALLGDFVPAMVEIRHAQELDPLSLPINVGAGAFLYYARRYEEALVEYQRVVPLDSTSALLNRAMAACYHQMGRDAEAARAVQRWLDNEYPGELASEAARGNREHGFPGMLRVLVRALVARRSAGLYQPATQIAELHALLGNRESALRWLTVADREHDTQLNRLRVDPIFDLLRGDPRFVDLVRRVGLSGTLGAPAG